MHVKEVVETKEVAECLKVRGLLKKYIKAVRYILDNQTTLVELKKRKPNKDEIWQFRVSGKYRAYCYIKTGTLHVFHISDHQ